MRTDKPLHLQLKALKRKAHRLEKKYDKVDERAVIDRNRIMKTMESVQRDIKAIERLTGVKHDSIQAQ